MRSNRNFTTPQHSFLRYFLCSIAQLSNYSFVQLLGSSGESVTRAESAALLRAVRKVQLNRGSSTSFGGSQPPSPAPLPPSEKKKQKQKQQHEQETGGGGAGDPPSIEGGRKLFAEDGRPAASAAFTPLTAELFNAPPLGIQGALKRHLWSHLTIKNVYPASTFPNNHFWSK